MTEVSIRPLVAADIEALTALAHEIWHASYPGIISRGQIDFMLDQRYSPAAIGASLATQHWDAAWLGDEMVGFAHSFADTAPSTWKLDKLYVHPDQQRKGIGLALLLKVKQHAIDASANLLVLRVNKRNTAALSAYAKYGFSVYGEHVLDIGNGFAMDDYLLELKLCS
jgi:ribosomal protein S18 acetylase RimI-like enzyme